MTKRIVVPIEGATNVTLYGEHYDVEDDGCIEVPNGVAKRVLADPDLQHAAAFGRKWEVKGGADTPKKPVSAQKDEEE